ncbi:hypothetical protein FD754_024768, partial [Muntiacus muntjak]
PPPAHTHTHTHTHTPRRSCQKSESFGMHNLLVFFPVVENLLCMCPCPFSLPPFLTDRHPQCSDHLEDNPTPPFQWLCFTLAGTKTLFLYPPRFPQMTMKTKQRMLTEDWELFKQRRFIEEQFTKKKAVAGENSFTDTMRHVLSSRLSVPDCPNCNYRRRCACDDCSLSHILTCGIMDPPVTGDIHIHQLPLPVDTATDCLSEMRPPGVSSASSGSASSSPITVQQHPRLILTDNGSAPTFCSDDEDVAPLSAKFADIYPLSNYEDAEVVASMNGVHGELNGGGENLALKDESPQVSSTSGSSSEADDEEADGESSGEPPGAPKEDTALGNGSPREEESKVDSPPPSYPAPQPGPGPAPPSPCFPQPPAAPALLPPALLTPAPAHPSPCSPR